MKSNYEMVRHLNSVFGNTPPATQADVEKQLRLINEEVKELSEGIAKKDIEEIRDAISDILVVTYGMGHILDLPVDEDMLAVQTANLSKLCTTPEECSATVKKYADLGIEVYSEGEYPEVCIKSLKDQTGSDGAFYPKNKFLKCVNWHVPEFSPVPPCQF